MPFAESSVFALRSAAFRVGATRGGLNLECKTSGNACSDGTECCSKLCGEDGRCDIGSSFCTQSGDVCGRNAECCTGLCQIAEGATVGTCAPPPTGASSEDRYELELYTALGDLVWEDRAIPSASGSSTVELSYAGPPLVSGMIYQFRVTSYRDRQSTPTAISRSEDLRGVFQYEP